MLLVTALLFRGNFCALIDMNPMKGLELEVMERVKTHVRAINDENKKPLRINYAHSM